MRKREWVWQAGSGASRGGGQGHANARPIRFRSSSGEGGHHTPDPSTGSQHSQRPDSPFKTSSILAKKKKKKGESRARVEQEAGGGQRAGCSFHPGDDWV